MLRKTFFAAACFALGMASYTQSPVQAQSQNANVVSSCGNVTYDQLQSRPMTQDVTGKLCTAASVSASVSGFAPGLVYATLTATNASASVALPAGAVVGFQNTGTTTVSCTLGVGSATAAASQIQVPANSTVFITVGANTFGACIDQTGSVSNVVVLMGGTGLGTGFGGGGGGSGGGGAITAAASSYSAGAFVAGTGVDGWDITQGLKTDAQCTSGATTPCSISARMAHIETLMANPIPTGGNAIGTLVASTPATPIVAAASDNHQTLKNGTGVAMSVHVSNNSATKNYLRLYDAGTGFNGCNSATGVIFAFEIPPTDSGFSISLGGGNGISFTNGLSLCVTSGFGLTDVTAATATAIYVNASYR